MDDEVAAMLQFGDAGDFAFDLHIIIEKILQRFCRLEQITGGFFKPFIELGLGRQKLKFRHGHPKNLLK
jgi:hypothetical protein